MSFEKKIIITKLQNGYLVRVKKSGESLLKEPFESSRFVFETEKTFWKWLEAFFKDEKEE